MPRHGEALGGDLPRTRWRRRRSLGGATPTIPPHEHDSLLPLPRHTTRAREGSHGDGRPNQVSESGDLTPNSARKSTLVLELDLGRLLTVVGLAAHDLEVAVELHLNLSSVVEADLLR